MDHMGRDDDEVIRLDHVKDAASKPGPDDDLNVLHVSDGVFDDLRIGGEHDQRNLLVPADASNGGQCQKRVLSLPIGSAATGGDDNPLPWSKHPNGHGRDCRSLPDAVYVVAEHVVGRFTCMNT